MTMPLAAFLAGLRNLPWVRIQEVFEHDLNLPAAFDLVLLEFSEILRDAVLNQRGPGLLGYFDHLELNFSLRGTPSYYPDSKVIRVNIGFCLFANELGATCDWLESILLSSNKQEIPIAELMRLEAPTAVLRELRALFAVADTGGLEVSGQFGLANPIAMMMLRFALAHEIGHMIMSAESPRLQEHWKETAWSDYAGALDFAVQAGWIDNSQRFRLSRASLRAHVADQWVQEVIADGIGFDTVLRLSHENDCEASQAYARLQVAVELFLHAVAILYRADLGTESHPPPLLRACAMRETRRKVHRVGWEDFLTQYWGPGFITDQLLSKTIPTLGARQ